MTFSQKRFRAIALIPALCLLQFIEWGEYARSKGNFLILTSTLEESSPLLSNLTTTKESSWKRDDDGKAVKLPVAEVYYINLDKNMVRRQNMENWLSEQKERGSRRLICGTGKNVNCTRIGGLSYQRISALKGDPNSCQGRHNHSKGCVGLSGLARTVVSLIDSLHENVKTATSYIHQRNVDNNDINVDNYTGRIANTTSSAFRAYPYEDSVYVLEDDYYLNFTAANEYVRRYVPDDWEIIRFNPWLWQPIPSSFRRVNQYVVRNSREGRPCDNRKPPPGQLNDNPCWFCGGTHAMLWRISALSKLRKLWSKEPYLPIDCRLNTDSVIGYLLFTGDDPESRKEHGHFLRSGNETSDVSGLKD